MHISPMNDFVMISKKEQAQKTAGGLFIPGNVQEENIITGEIVACGPGRILENGNLIPTTVKPGNIVLMPRSGMSFKFDNREFIMAREEQILAIISE